MTKNKVVRKQGHSGTPRLQGGEKRIERSGNIVKRGLVGLGNFSASGSRFRLECTIRRSLASNAFVDGWGTLSDLCEVMWSVFAPSASGCRCLLFTITTIIAITMPIKRTMPSPHNRFFLVSLRRTLCAFLEKCFELTWSRSACAFISSMC